MDELGLKHYAYIGDAVWELFVRNIMVLRTNNSQELHKISTERVNAAFQAKLLDELQFILSEEEQDLARRARNLSVPVGRKSNQAEYRLATSFEALVGWWYKNDSKRLKEIEQILINRL